MAVAASGTDPASLGSTGVIPRARVRWHRPPVPFNIPALVLVAAGAALQMVAIASSIWLSTPAGRLAFSGMREWAQPGFAHAFFSWFALTLVAVTTVFGVLACLHWRWAPVFRYLGALLGVAGVFLTVGAVLLLAYQSHNETFHLARNYSVGPYLALLGLFVGALGAAGGTGHRG
jgi:hypothetical protein